MKFFTQCLLHVKLVCKFMTSESQEGGGDKIDTNQTFITDLILYIRTITLHVISHHLHFLIRTIVNLKYFLGYIDY